MRMHGEVSNGHLASVAKRRYPNRMVHEKNIPCEGSVRLVDAFVDYNSRSEYYRPYLVMQGFLESVRVNRPEPFPFGVTAIDFEETKQPPVVYRYQLTNEEIANLAAKGMFGTLDRHGKVCDSGFTCPSLFFSAKFDLPMMGEVLALQPETEQDMPVLFFGVENPFDIQTDSMQSGYEDISQYFEMAKGAETKDLDWDLDSGYQEQQHESFLEGAQMDDYLGKEADDAKQSIAQAEQQRQEQMQAEEARMAVESPEEYAERMEMQQAMARISSVMLQGRDAQRQHKILQRQSVQQTESAAEEAAAIEPDANPDKLAPVDAANLQHENDQDRETRRKAVEQTEFSNDIDDASAVASAGEAESGQTAPIDRTIPARFDDIAKEYIAEQQAADEDKSL